MKKAPLPIFLVLLGCLHAGCTLADEGIRAFGRSVNLEPYLTVSGPIFVDPGAGQVYLEKVSGDGKQLTVLVYLMGGAPEETAEKWLDRSPLIHAERVSAPLLLLHGTSDRRVDLIESRSMAQRLRELGKPVTYVELPGAGHNSRPVSQLYAYWDAVFDFVEDAVRQPVTGNSSSQ